MKPILDVCCGGKMFYFDKHDPRVLFCDKRRIKTTLCDGRNFAVDPDIVADFTQLPFADCSFRIVVFDPPHLLSSKEKPTGWQQIKYGYLGNDWPTLLKQGFKECFRVLEPNGTLIFKWNETDIPLKEILKLTNQRPVLGHKSGKRSNTHWVLFVKPAAAKMVSETPEKKPVAKTQEKITKKSDTKKTDTKKKPQRSR